jgi:hypothetical protein
MEPAPQFERFTGQARRAILLAYQEAQRFDHDHLASEHLLSGLLREGSAEVANVFLKQEIPPAEVLEKLEQLFAHTKPGPMTEAIYLTPRATQALNSAIDLARIAQESRAGSAHILLALLAAPEGPIRTFLHDLGFDPELGATALRSANSGPNRDLLVSREAARVDSGRVDPTAAQLTQLLSGETPHVALDLAEPPPDINPYLAEADFQLFLTQLMLALTMGLAGGYTLDQSVDAMAAAGIVFALVACFRNSVLGFLAGATLGGMIAQKVQPGNGALETPIEAMVPLILVGGFLGSFIGNFWRRFTPKYLHPSTTHQKPPGVV